MRYLVTAYSDVGIVKKVNQDSVLYLSAECDLGPVLLCVICDGMGGLSKGELASATLVKTFERWFKKRLPQILGAHKGISEALLQSEWNGLILEANKKLYAYGAKIGNHLGTTVTALLLFKKQYYIVNVGDSRVYEIEREMRLMTKDHTYVQRQMDLGRMTYEQAMSDPHRNMLLQCVGASEVLVPDYYFGLVRNNGMYMLCSDGFRHLIAPEELFATLKPANNPDVKKMRRNLEVLTQVNKERNEKDNISAILVKIITD